MGIIYKNSIPYGGGDSSLPDGGTTGQALVKKSDADKDVEWKDIAGDSIQVDTMPTAEASLEGKIYQYVGATTADYVNGYFYKCVEEGAVAPDPMTYKWVAINVQSGGSGSGLPAGGTTGQILAKNSDDDGDAGWIVDTGKDLNKLVQWGTNNSQRPKTESVPTITDATQDPYHRAILHIPIEGSALQGIEATEASLKQYLKTRFKIRYGTGLSGTAEFTTTTEDTAGDGSNSFGMKTNLTSSYDDSRLYIYLNETTISNNTLHLAVSYYVHFAISQTNHYGKPQNVTLIANDGYTFGVTPVGDPYYIHNSTKIALDDLKINDINIPTDWGVAKTGNLKMYMTNKQSYQYLWFGNLGFTSVDDYMIFVDITGGMEAAWGKPTVIVSNKSATEAGISLECDSPDATWFNVNYVIIAKGYGNLTEGGSGGSETLDEVLTNGNEATDKTIALKNSTDNGTTEIDSYGITQSYDDGAGLGNFAQFAGGSLVMSETNTNDNNNAYIGAKHMNMSSTDSNGDPLNHFAMEWSEVANVDMSDDLKEAWRNALGGGVGMAQEVIYSASATVGTDVQETTKPVTDYDMLVVSINIKSSETDIQNHNMVVLPSQIVFNTGSIRYTDGTTDRYVVYRFNDATHFQAVTGNGYWITKITGITFGSKLDGTIGRWEKIAEVPYTDAGTISLELSKYNAIMIGAGNRFDVAPPTTNNSAFTTIDNFDIGDKLVAIYYDTDDVTGNRYFTISRTGANEISYTNGFSVGGVIYGYKETGISDADVQKIAQEIPPAEDTMKVTFTGATTIQSADKTFSEIKEALDAGKLVYAQRNIYTGYTGGSEVLYRVYRYDDSEIIFINNMMDYYGAAAATSNKGVTEEVVLKSNNQISSRRYSFAPIYYAQGGYSHPDTGELGTIMLAGASDTAHNTKKGGLYINELVSGTRTWVPISEPAEATVAYSTSEQAVGTWVDGKTIYQKTMTCAMPTDIVDGTIKDTYVPHGVSNISQIIGCESVSKATSGNVGGEDGNISVGNMFTHISADSYQINLSANMSQFSGKEYFVTFRYTKTT